MRPIRPIHWALCALSLGASSLAAQGGMRHGDSTTAAVMQVVHQLLTNHEKLRRTVDNLPNGIRTVTESDDPAMVAQIQQHVAMTGTFVAAGHDPNLPMATAALRGVLRNGTKVVRRVERTATGVVVVETSDDPATVALLQQHAAEITDQVKRGMAAVHGGGMPAPAAGVASAPAGPPAAMPHMPGMRHREGMMPGMRHDTMHDTMHAMPHDPAAAPPTTRPTRAGQEAFATIAEIVRLLDADSTTDWSKVDLDALREHLRDMDDVTLRADIRATPVPGGATFDVQGTGRVRAAIRRMALSHGATIAPSDGFTWTATSTATGARVTIRAIQATDRRMEARIRALGFVGVLTLGDHHTAHHLGIANGTMRAHHQHD